MMQTDGRKYIDCFYYLNPQEAQEVPYKIYPRGERLYAVSLSDCYKNPDALLQIFKKRLNSPSNYGNRLNPTTYFGYQFFIIDDKNHDLNFFYPNQNKQTPQNDSLLLNNLIKSNGFEIFQSGKRPKLDHTAWNSLQLETIFEEQLDRLCIITRRLQSSNPEIKLLFNIAKNRSNDLSYLPTYLCSLIKTKVLPALIETRKEYPLKEIIDEAKICLEEATIFSHHIYKELEKPIKNKIMHNPQEILSFYLTNPKEINVSRSDLLQSIKGKYPTYEYPKTLENTILTNLDFNQPNQELQPTTTQPFEIKIKTQENSVVIKEMALNEDIQKYIHTFDMHIDVFHMKPSKKITPDELTAEQILEKIPCFYAEWHKKPIATIVNFDNFWSKSGGELRNALYNPPYGTTEEETIELFDEDFINLLFLGKPPHEWVVFSSSTHNNYFINEWWDYLWISFSKDGNNIVVIAATATD